MGQTNDGDHSLEQILDRSHELRKQSERLKHEVTELAEKVERLQRRPGGQVRGNAVPSSERSNDGAPSNGV